MGWLLKLGLAALALLLVYRWLRARLGRAAPSMTASEARALLGVGESANLAEIREAHRRLISRVHPDIGGSSELATRVNAARDALVAELNRGPPRAS